MGKVINKKQDICEKDYINILKRICNILEKNKINYWLFAGTLLGCIRDNHFISWDDDIDIAIDNSSFVKTLTLINTFKKNNFTFCIQQEKGNYKKIILTDPSIPHFHIDLYEIKLYNNKYIFKRTLVNNLPTILSYKILGIYINLTNKDYSKHVNKSNRIIKYIFRSINHFFGTKQTLIHNNLGTEKIKYYGIATRIPKNYKEYLVLMYGDTWRIPNYKFDNTKISKQFIKEVMKDGREICYL